MSEANDATQYISGAKMTLGDAPVATQQQPLPGLPAPQPLALNPTVQAVVTGVQAVAEPTVWAEIAASVISMLQPEINIVLALSRASPKTTATVAAVEDGVAVLAGVLGFFFPHPKA